MRRIAVLDAPSNLGLRPPTATSVPGCAKAPGALRDHGLLTRLGARDAGCLTPPRYDAGDWRPGDGVAHAAQIAAYSRALAGRIGAILDAGEFPVILGGDCSILLGSGIAMNRLGEAIGGRIGLVFVDGHSDFRHPGNASYVGAAAGEDLALVTGRGQADLAAIEGRRPYFRDIDVVVLGIRAQDEYRLDLQAAGIVTRPVPALRAEGAARSAQWAREQLADCAGYWVHIDVDVLDPAVMPAVDAPSPGGIAFPELELLLAGLVESPHCLGVEITVFDPDYDPDGEYAAEITSAVSAGLAAAHRVALRPDLAAARRDLDRAADGPTPRDPDTLQDGDEATHPGRLAKHSGLANDGLAPSPGGAAKQGGLPNDGGLLRPGGVARQGGLENDGGVPKPGGAAKQGGLPNDGAPANDGGLLRPGGVAKQSGPGNGGGLANDGWGPKRLGVARRGALARRRGPAEDDEAAREHRRAEAAAESVSLAAEGASSGVSGTPEEPALPATTLLGVEEGAEVPAEQPLDDAFGEFDDTASEDDPEADDDSGDDTFDPSGGAASEAPSEAADGQSDELVDATDDPPGEARDGPSDKLLGESADELSGEAVGESAGELSGELVSESAGELDDGAVGESAAESSGEVVGEAAGELSDGAADESAGGPDGELVEKATGVPGGAVPGHDSATARAEVADEAETGDPVDSRPGDAARDDSAPDGLTSDEDSLPAHDAVPEDAVPEEAVPEEAVRPEGGGDQDGPAEHDEGRTNRKRSRLRPRNGAAGNDAAVQLLSRPLGSAPLLDSEPLPATRPGMLRPRRTEPDGEASEGFSLPAQRPAFDVGSGEPADIA